MRQGDCHYLGSYSDTLAREAMVIERESVDESVDEEVQLRDQLANWTIQQAEERARVFRDLQAKVDAEELKRQEAEYEDRRLVEEREAAERAMRHAEEADAAQVKYEQERAAWEAAERVRLTAEATDQLQEALLTQDAPTLRAAISAYGPILKEANASAHSDLQVAIRYLAQLDAAAAAFASEYNSAVADLHTLTHADVTQVKAEATLARLKVAAERAAAVGAPEEMMGAAQVCAALIQTSFSTPPCTVAHRVLHTSPSRHRSGSSKCTAHVTR
mmetsp:Transcript_36057/g.94973  ORF Transcript_36057/g.94973 Transcript_36057/m.94973 type:complete len:274 (-) Transcript_36057:1778-2599(-)